MGSMKLWLCVFLVLLSLQNNEARVRGSYSNKGSSQTAMESAKELLKASIERQVGRHLESKRRSPGGPDPRHH
ncbi:PREDICTED: CLAVATA3/ESR (CLE)-related protein 4-like [Prunus mume]|uniref:CLAVATA3/ESR (CLE)-related protein 4-like n=1 Tax=Prunus mume TaxID=102107 RepID=A0ABM1LRH2_PRUMU|nr:PREDICTED: CLAVATA3/ESR (CLE)-related protein 4-like [Prunus mume]